MKELDNEVVMQSEQPGGFVMLWRFCHFVHSTYLFILLESGGFGSVHPLQPFTIHFIHHDAVAASKS